MKKAYLIIKNKSKSKKERTIYLFKTLLKNNFKADFVNDELTFLTLNKESDLAVIYSSFLAIKEDFDSSIKILILPLLNRSLFEYINKVNTGEIKTLFEIIEIDKEIYKKLFYLINDINEEVLKTVKCYIEENKSPLNSSLRLFCHRNTVSYRIKVFEKKTKINLDSFFNEIFAYYLIKYKLEGKEND